MASKTYSVYLLQESGISVMVMQKAVKRITFRVMKSDSSTIQASVPQVLTKMQVRQCMRDNQARLIDMLAKAAQKERRRLALPNERSMERLRSWIEELAPDLERAMGLAARGYTLRYMTSRWGSCRPATRAITINAALGQLPREYTEYVLVHELAHIAHPDHSPAFWAMVGRFFPDYARVRKRLRDYTL